MVDMQTLPRDDLREALSLIHRDGQYRSADLNPP